MDKIIIVGAGGFGREVQWLIERINKTCKTWDLLGFIDDSIAKGTIINGIPVLGTVKDLIDSKEGIAVACAVGASATRKKIIQQLKSNNNITFPNLLDPSVLMSSSIKLGIGDIICAGSILTVNIVIDNFVIINLDCTIGHDAELQSFTTLYPNVNVSGNVFIGTESELGTGTKIIQQVNILNNTIVGAGAIVIRDIPSRCVAVGNPAKPIKFLK